MSREQLAQHLDAPRQTPPVGLDLRGRAGEFLTTEEACAILRFTGTHRLRSLYRFVAVNGIRKHYRSPRRLLLLAADISQALGLRRG